MLCFWQRGLKIAGVLNSAYDINPDSKVEKSTSESPPNCLAPSIRADSHIQLPVVRRCLNNHF